MSKIKTSMNIGQKIEQNRNGVLKKVGLILKIKLHHGSHLLKSSKINSQDIIKKKKSKLNNKKV